MEESKDRRWCYRVSLLNTSFISCLTMLRYDASGAAPVRKIRELAS